MCCNNRNYQVKSDKNNLDLSKNDSVDDYPARKNTVTEMEVMISTDKIKIANKKGIIEKHMKDNSFRINTSTKNETVKLDKRIQKLIEITNKSKILILKVI